MVEAPRRRARGRGRRSARMRAPPAPTREFPSGRLRDGDDGRDAHRVALPPSRLGSRRSHRKGTLSRRPLEEIPARGRSRRRSQRSERSRRPGPADRGVGPRHGGGQRGEEGRRAVARGRAQHEGAAERGQRIELGGEREERGPGDEIDLVEDEPGLARGRGETLDDRAEVGGSRARVGDEEGDVRLGRALPGGGEHRPIEPAPRGEDPGQVHQHDLRGVPRRRLLEDDAVDPKPCRLRLRRDDREPGPDQAVEQCGLAGVWRADQGDQPGAGRAHERCERSSEAASLSASRLVPALPVPVLPPTVTVIEKAGACGGPWRSAST